MTVQHSSSVSLPTPATDSAPAPPVVRRPSPRRVFWSVLAGTLLVQLALILALPAFAGIDEFDHVYKADSVAHGQLRGTVAATDGRGQLLHVSPGVLEAAAPTCESYDYTGPDNCRVVERRPDGLVSVASAAASYNPVYYAVVGLAARPFDGDAAGYAMRVTTAVWSAALIAGAAAVTARWARGPWPALALAVAATPTLLYSGVVAAPNGVGYAAALLWWACAVAVVVGSRRPPWLLLTVSSSLMLVTHVTNLMWLPLMVVVVLVLRPVSWWADVLRHQAASRWSAVAVTVVACGAAGWVQLADSARFSPWRPIEPEPLTATTLADSQVLWVLQTIAAMPTRTEPSPMLVYPMWLMALLVVLLTGLRAATPRVRVGMLLLLVAWVVIPIVLSIATYDAEPLAWQGRYALPLVLGLPALAALALRERETRLRPFQTLMPVLTGLATVVAVVALAVRTGGRGLAPSLAAVAPGGVPVAATVVGALTVLGLLVAASAWRPLSASPPPSAPGSPRRLPSRPPRRPEPSPPRPAR